MVNLLILFKLLLLVINKLSFCWIFSKNVTDCLSYLIIVSGVRFLFALICLSLDKLVEFIVNIVLNWCKLSYRWRKLFKLILCIYFSILFIDIRKGKSRFSFSPIIIILILQRLNNFLIKVIGIILYLVIKYFLFFY